MTHLRDSLRCGCKSGVCLGLSHDPVGYPHSDLTNDVFEVDLVHEGVTWFRDRGGRTATFSLVVSAP